MQFLQKALHIAKMCHTVYQQQLSFMFFFVLYIAMMCFVFSTAKYSFLSFFYKFPFEQFRKYANCFFLFIALMQVRLSLCYNVIQVCHTRWHEKCFSCCFIGRYDQFFCTWLCLLCDENAVQFIFSNKQQHRRISV